MDGFDVGLNYLLDCQLLDTTDAIRSQVFQLNATKEQWTSQKAFDLKRHELLAKLSQKLDSESGKNTYLSPALIDAISRSSPHLSMTRCQSALYSLSTDQLLASLNISSKMDDSSDCEVVHVVIKKKADIEEINLKRRISNKSGKISENEGINGERNDPNETKRTKIFDTLGSHRNSIQKRPPTPTYSSTVSSSSSIVTPKNGHSSNSLMSPTRVPGIFRSNPLQRNVRNEEQIEEQPQNKYFISGYEKKIVEDVKNGSLSLRAARRELKQFRPPFKEKSNEQSSLNDNKDCDPHLKNIDKHLIETIENEIITRFEPIKRQDVAGLEFAKNKINEIAILPLKKPHLFTGLRKPPKGILLFGPPGTGKTFLGRWIASETQSTFFEITVSTLNSKWIGEGEKTIRAMFAVARARQPSVIFIDEIDSLLKSRCDSEHESSRRMKTEFFTQFEGVTTATDEKLLIIGTTNRPEDLDEAARRRLTARLYIGLPEESARIQIIENLLRPEKHTLTDQQIKQLAQKTEGYSGADMNLLCKEAALEGLRELQFNDDMDDINEENIRNITFEDFEKQLEYVKPSVNMDDLKSFEEWDRQYGTNRR